MCLPVHARLWCDPRYYRECRRGDHLCSYAHRHQENRRQCCPPRQTLPWYWSEPGVRLLDEPGGRAFLMMEKLTYDNYTPIVPGRGRVYAAHGTGQIYRAHVWKGNTAPLL